MIPIYFSNHVSDEIWCLLDSGADYSTFPVSIGEGIGIDFKDEDPIDPPKQISGNITNKCYQKATEIHLPNLNQAVYLSITWIDSNDVDPVIGRIGFFDKFGEVVFDESKKQIILRHSKPKH